MGKITRRGFVRTSITGAAALSAGVSSLNALPAAQAKSPNETVVLALIGAGGRGQKSGLVALGPRHQLDLLRRGQRLATLGHRRVVRLLALTGLLLEDASGLSISGGGFLGSRGGDDPRLFLFLRRDHDSGVELGLFAFPFLLLKFDLRDDARLIAGGIAAKLLLGPALGIGLALLLGAEGLTRSILFLYACMPTAINGLLLAVRFRARPNLLGGILTGVTLLSPLTVTAVLYWLGIE